MVEIKDRIRELRRIKASELVPNPKNWRRHDRQPSAALKGLLTEIGYAGALLARELPNGKLILIDGHLRAETTPRAMGTAMAPIGAQVVTDRSMIVFRTATGALLFLSARGFFLKSCLT